VLGERVFNHGYGPFGIIYAYHPYLSQHEELLRANNTEKPTVDRTKNRVGSEYGNRASFKILAKALIQFHQDNGIPFTKIVEHAVSNGIFTEELVAALQEAGIETEGIEFYGLDLNVDAMEGAQVGLGTRLPASMKLHQADLGDAEALIQILEGEEAARGTVVAVGAGFHEVRNKTDEQMIEIFEKYRKAGIVLAFVETTDFTTEQIRASGWQSYHAGFRWVHRTSGQILRGPYRMDGQERMSWTEIAEAAGYEILGKYSPSTNRTLKPVYDEPVNPPLEKIFFCRPKISAPGPVTSGSGGGGAGISMGTAALTQGSDVLTQGASAPAKTHAHARRRGIGHPNPLATTRRAGKHGGLARSAARFSTVRPL
ncbi:MAG: hypothetical protein Q7T11_03025, partial [Deltaproteobacteria bacterium]|nr:hypothetical protein [Deltaproteobacteria bacterium]